ncbi:Glycosyltransferase [Myroides sp. A21]|uniref:glycosyltransferase family 4 protein n=1 Tax=Myroides sp. A21 TaxID=1583100 RepID=UPI00057D682D|nr:glycosyltransferase family 4 protein [Myroides sp. A21]AJA70384.1 Glycosyltransferase [Myroides sp. A21]
MNILFLTLVGIKSIQDRGLYQDLLREFRNEGHDVHIVCPVERRLGIQSNVQKKEGINLLQVKTLNITKSNIVEKGIGTLAIEYQYLSAIKKYYRDIKFDLVLYSTPPITFSKVISYIKNRDNGYSYLLLKDIFPQNAVDMGMLKKGGILHRFFEKKERELYSISDTIGCMSPANISFLLNNNTYLDSEKVEVNPNTIEPLYLEFTEEEKNNIRVKYNLPLENKIFVYGGNLGKPQGLEFLLETIDKCEREDAYFLIVGDGTEYNKLEQWFNGNKPSNAKLLKRLPKKDYDLLLASCDIGLIFLHPNFLIPNFPSRLLSYLEMGIPILSATDENTDVGDILEKNNCGKKVISGDIESMLKLINYLVDEADLANMGENGKELLDNEYLVKYSYDLIIKKVNNV